jgi:phage gpG-like protein
MLITLTRISDTMTPDLHRRFRLVKDKRPIHAAMGMAVISLAKRAFNDPSLRPTPWKAKKDGTASRLRDTGTLAKSPRIALASQTGVTVGSDRLYAAIHQLGGKTPPRIIRPVKGKALKIPGIGFRKKVNHPGSDIPARPYFPFDATGRPTAKALEAIGRVVRLKLR